VDTFHDFSISSIRIEKEMNVDFADDQNTLVGFYLACHIGAEPAIAGVDFARFQRAPEGSNHSTAQGGYNVIKRRRVRFGQFRGIHAIMPGDGSMDTEDNWLRLARQPRYSQRPGPPFNLNFGYINRVGHCLSLHSVVSPCTPSSYFLLRTNLHPLKKTAAQRSQVLSISAPFESSDCGYEFGS
jgi:hypothetical protein